MTTFYFVGQEDCDFSAIGVTSADTATTAARRTAYARCSLKTNSVGISGVNAWNGAHASAQSTFWFTARFYLDVLNNASAGSTWLALKDGVNWRLGLTNTSATNAGVIRLVKKTVSGTVTTLATSTQGFTVAQTKLDIFVNYAVSGACKVYANGVLIIDYSGDVTTDSATTLDGFWLGSPSSADSNTNTYWSEVIVASTDTRSMALCTLPPAAAGNTSTFTSGAYTDINETTLSDSTMLTSATAAQIAEFTVTSSGLTGNPAVLAVAVSARAQKGTTGPSKADLMVRTASTDYLSSDISLSTSLATIQNFWTTNPNTSAAWALSDLTAGGFNVGIKSVT